MNRKFKNRKIDNKDFKNVFIKNNFDKISLEVHIAMHSFFIFHFLL